MIYIASPYTHADAEVMEARYLRVMRFTRDLLLRKKPVYSPIVHCHEMAKLFQMPPDFDFWCDYNFDMIERSTSLYVYCDEGWDVSRGVTAEIKFAQELCKHIVYWSPEGDRIKFNPEDAWHSAW